MRISSSSSPIKSHGGNRVIRRATMAIILIVSFGYLVLWGIAGLSVDVKLYNRVSAATNSTYFGSQGPMIVLYISPVLLISVLGCLYLHLGNNEIQHPPQRKMSQSSTWKRPMIVKGLGIVSWTELAIFATFVSFLVWDFFSYLKEFAFFHDIRHPPEHSHKFWTILFEKVGVTLGCVGDMCIAFLFFPVTRGSSVLAVFGLSSEASIKYHIWLGHITMFVFTAHGLAFLVSWIFTNQFYKVLTWNAISVSNVAGELSLLFGLLLWITTYPRIRRKMFELFFYTHYFYILFMVFYVLHLGITHCYIAIPGFYLFLIDRFLRFLQSRSGVRLVSARVLPCQTLELNFSKSQDLRYNATSGVFVNVPSISRLQWHPFTISSNSNLEPDKLSIIVKTEGSWTQKLYRTLSETSSAVDRLRVSVEGPYGPVSTHFLRHDTLVMVSGGSGISPFISIIREFVYIKSKTPTRETPNLVLVSAFKHSSELAMLDLILPISTTHHHHFTKLDLKIEAYVTREQQPLTIEQQPDKIQTIWFKPESSDSPVSPILGPNGWLWLGAIIASSFAVFLLSVGILTRSYVYPIDRNTGTVYSHTWQSMLNMLILCASIGIAASVGFVWNKRAAGKAMEGVGFSDHVDDDREMGSLLPLQSLWRSTKVHYGGRPDLKRILMDLKDESVGVLVCGPKDMRHDVAAICSSHQNHNLHFESISFSW